MQLTSRMEVPFVRRVIVVAMLSLALAAIGFVARQDIYRYAYLEPRLVLAALGSLALLGTTLLLQLYLRGAIFTPIKDKDGVPIDIPSSVELRTEFARSIEHSRADIEKLRNQVSDLQIRTSSGPVSKDHDISGSDQIQEMLRLQIREKLTAEIESRLANALLREHVLEEARQTFDSSSRRLQQELGSLTRRANVNLLIGVATTVIAVSLLVYMVLTASAIFAGWTELFSHYIPRIATVIFIEIFSFFFLRLYRASLAEIKYYQNELTALDTTRIALHASQMQDDSKGALAVISALSKSDRNKDTSESSGAALTSKEVKEFTEAFEKLAKASTGLLQLQK